MAVQNEASGLRSNRELGDDAKDCVITDFVLSFIWFLPNLLFGFTKNSNLSIVSMQDPLFEMFNAFFLSTVPIKWSLWGRCES